MLALVRHPDQAAALLQPIRLRLLEALREPQSAAAAARRLELPRQAANYHLRELERAGLVEFVEERRKGNCVERIFRASAARYFISPEALGALGDSAGQEPGRFSVAWLAATAARVLRDLGILSLRAQRAGKRLATLTLESEIRFRSPADRAAFAEELTTTLAELTRKYHAPDGRSFRILAAAYPMITREEDDGPNAAALPD